MKDIKCDGCKKIIGMVEKDTYIECDDRYYGVEILCKKCKDKKPDDCWEFRCKNVNILFDNQQNKKG